MRVSITGAGRNGAFWEDGWLLFANPDLSLPKTLERPKFGLEGSREVGSDPIFWYLLRIGGNPGGMAEDGRPIFFA
jgi:hypothetical protein